jgi:uncharacterized protein (UPF0276 family)
MRIGINITSAVSLGIAKNLKEKGKLTHLEFLIDNFLHLNPESLLEYTDGVTCGFHIMSSRFLERNIDDLRYIARRIKLFTDTLKPKYLSDHIGVFTTDHQDLPMIAEYDYKNSIEQAISKVIMWQDMLSSQVLLENYPSVFISSMNQTKFFSYLQEATGCGLLFDLSNALIADLNKALDISEWIELLKKVKYLHIGGYRSAGEEPDYIADTHDVEVSLHSLANLQFLFHQNFNFESIVIERDSNINMESIENDLDKILDCQSKSSSKRRSSIS